MTPPRREGDSGEDDYQSRRGVQINLNGYGRWIMRALGAAILAVAYWGVSSAQLRNEENDRERRREIRALQETTKALEIQYAADREIRNAMKDTLMKIERRLEK